MTMTNSVTDVQAMEALESLDDLARMDISVAAPGAYNLLRRFILQHATTPGLADMTRSQLDAAPASEQECPNCVSPWKCNGPHIGLAPEHDYDDATPKPEPGAGLADDAEVIGALNFLRDAASESTTISDADVAHATVSRALANVREPSG